MLCASFPNFAAGYAVDDESDNKIIPGTIHLLRERKGTNSDYGAYCGFRFAIPLCAVNELSDFEYARICVTCRKHAGGAVPAYEGRVTKW
jgi:hypothetical protein